MACPYFEPVARLQDRRWTRLPLGDTYEGVCHASSRGAPSSGPALSRDLCNLGYARGHCSRFPLDAPADAVRFSIYHEDTTSISIQFILEKEYFPLEHGLLKFAPGAGFFQANCSDLLLKQAGAFVDNYLRRKVPV